jgi:hypothetical protein
VFSSGTIPTDITGQPVRSHVRTCKKVPSFAHAAAAGLSE